MSRHRLHPVCRKHSRQWVGNTRYSGSEAPGTVGRKHPIQWVGNTRYSGSETPDTVDLKHSRQRVGHIRYSESVPTQLPAIYLKEGANNWKVYYICRDYLGSITHIANSDGSLK